MPNARSRVAMMAVAAVLLTACSSDSQTDLFVEIQCDREMFVAVLDVTDLESWESPDIYVDDAKFLDPHVEESVGLFDLSARRIEVVVFTTTQPFRFSEPFKVSQADLVLKNEFDEGPPSVLVIPAESCPSPDDPPR